VLLFIWKHRQVSVTSVPVELHVCVYISVSVAVRIVLSPLSRIESLLPSLLQGKYKLQVTSTSLQLLLICSMGMFFIRYPYSYSSLIILFLLFLLLLLCCRFLLNTSSAIIYLYMERNLYIIVSNFVMIKFCLSVKVIIDYFAIVSYLLVVI